MRPSPSHGREVAQAFRSRQRSLRAWRLLRSYEALGDIVAADVLRSRSLTDRALPHPLLMTAASEPRFGDRRPTVASSHANPWHRDEAANLKVPRVGDRGGSAPRRNVLPGAGAGPGRTQGRLPPHPGGPVPGSFLHTLQVGRPVVTRGRQPVDEASPPCDLVRCHSIT